MSTLPVTLPLHNVQDVESLVRKVADQRLRKWGARLKHTDFEDLISYLISTCWELSERYDPALDKQKDTATSKGGFASYASRILELRCADWFRSNFGDTRHGERPIVLSLDAPLSLAHGSDKDLHETGYGGDSPLADQLERALASSEGDPAEDRSPDLVGVLLGGRGGEAGALETLGEPPPGRAPRRARATAAVKAPARVMPRNAKPLPRRNPELPPPVCTTCVATFKSAFERSNRFRKKEDRLSAEQIIDMAYERSRAVRFEGDWACPRCTTVTLPEGAVLFLEHVHPNRQSRRAAARLKRQPGAPRQTPKTALPR